MGRLSLVERNHNGFDLAQADLELRGPGDVFGLRQSGQPRLRASALLDGQLIITTKAEAEAVLDRDAALLPTSGVATGRPSVNNSLKSRFANSGALRRYETQTPSSRTYRAAKLLRSVSI